MIEPASVLSARCGCHVCTHSYVSLVAKVYCKVNRRMLWGSFLGVDPEASPKGDSASWLKNTRCRSTSLEYYNSSLAPLGGCGTVSTDTDPSRDTVCVLFPTLVEVCTSGKPKLSQFSEDLSSMETPTTVNGEPGSKQNCWLLGCPPQAKHGVRGRLDRHCGGLRGFQLLNIQYR